MKRAYLFLGLKKRENCFMKYSSPKGCVSPEAKGFRWCHGELITIVLGGRGYLAYVLVILGCVTNYSNSGASNNKHLSRNIWGSGIWHRLMGPLPQSLRKRQSTQVPSRADWLPSSLIVLAGFNSWWTFGLGTSVPHCCWSEASLSFLTYGSLYWAAHSMAAAFHQSEWTREQERKVKWKSFCNLFSEVVSHTLLNFIH